jgi:hypothetical protein
MDATSSSWSPDGTTLSFNVYCCHFAGIVANIYTMHSDGLGLHELTHNTDVHAGPFDASWSPDGRMITFAHFPGAPGDQHGDIYTMNAAGTNVVDITHTRSDSSSEANREQGPGGGQVRRHQPQHPHAAFSPFQRPPRRGTVRSETCARDPAFGARCDSRGHFSEQLFRRALPRPRASPRRLALEAGAVVLSGTSGSTPAL